MQKITPFLWFDDNAKEAMDFYMSIFEESRVISVTRYGDSGPGMDGTVIVAHFSLNGQEFMAFNGGPQFTFSPAISFVVDCETQDEVDELWERLSAGGRQNDCGWLQDKFGVSWQIVPRLLRQMLDDTDPARAQRVMKAMLQMKKINIMRLQLAYDGA